MMTAPMNVGGRMPAHATALGKVMLAYLSGEELDEYLASAELTPVMPNTVTDCDVLRVQLKDIRETGYALADQELEVGLIALGAPVRDRRGRVVGAINVSTNVLRWPPTALMSQLKEPLLLTAGLIERDLAATA